MRRVLIILCWILFACSAEMNSSSGIYIRINQIGFLPGQNKSAVVLSSKDLRNSEFEIVDSKSKQIVFSGTIANYFSEYGSTPYGYKLDFSSLRKVGNYQIKIDGSTSYEFSIREDVFKNIPQNLLKFFMIQRCGYTNPLMHEVCHKADATSLIENGIETNRAIDLTGGWHDAGDYTKFLNTTAFATYTLLFSYVFNPSAFDFDENKNNVADILEEAKIGLDWLLRCNYEKFKLIVQVQDNRDHDVGWRLPEQDPLEFTRPAYAGIGKNLIGIYAATLALGAKIWREKFQLNEFADKCLNTAENLYSIRNQVPDIDTSGSGAYLDQSYEGKLALGAVELYNLTGRTAYLKDAKEYAEKAGPDYWWSYGNISSLAHFRIAEHDTSFISYIEQSLKHYKKYSENELFGQGVTFRWGSNNSLLGITLQNILYKKLTNSVEFDDIASAQLDYILGKNPWGVSFLSDFGKKSVKSLHHQISELKRRKLSGGFAAGPVIKSILDSANIQYSTQDKFGIFQTDSAYYRDDKMDYITNEPTIVANATAIFVFGNYR